MQCRNFFPTHIQLWAHRRQTFHKFIRACAYDMAACYKKNCRVQTGNPTTIWIVSILDRIQERQVFANAVCSCSFPVRQVCVFSPRHSCSVLEMAMHAMHVGEFLLKMQGVFLDMRDGGPPCRVFVTNMLPTDPRLAGPVAIPMRRRFPATE